MRTIVSLLLVAVLTGVASAQPGAQGPAPAPAPAPAPYPPPQPYPPPGYGYPMQLSPADQELLMSGEISDGQQVGGGLLALFLGYGSGQAVQGRFGETGWIFLLGEGASTVAFIKGFVDLLAECSSTTEQRCDDGAGWFVVGLLGVTIFRTWGTIDAFVGPTTHNRRVRALKMRLGMPIYSVAPYVAPAHDATTAGLMLRF